MSDVPEIQASDAMGVDGLMLGVHGALLNFVTIAQKGYLSVARDPLDIIEQLGQAPGRFRVIIAWTGEKSQGNKYSGIVEHEIQVVVSQNRGLEVLKGSNLFLRNDGPTLMNLVGRIREIMRALRFPNRITERIFTYVGCDPVAVNGTQIDAFTLTWKFLAALPPAQNE